MYEYNLFRPNPDDQVPIEYAGGQKETRRDTSTGLSEGELHIIRP